MEKVIIDYNKYGILIDNLVVKIKSLDIDFNAVHGLPRGGLPIAVHISHHLDIPLVISVNQFAQEYQNGKLLVVDDIIDTGKTYERFLEIITMNPINFIFATIFYKPTSLYTPEVYIKETTSWVIFPWETIDEKPSEYHQEIYPEINYTDDIYLEDS
jgi:hypoxanthine phosphoribosyltransferase